MAFLNRLEGRDGKVTVKGLGSLVGEVAQWTLERRGEDSPNPGVFDLRVVFSFLVPTLLMDPDYNEGRELTLVVSRSRVVRVKLDNPERMALNGKVLFLEGVEYEWLAV